MSQKILDESMAGSEMQEVGRLRRNILRDSIDGQLAANISSSELLNKKIQRNNYLMLGAAIIGLSAMACYGYVNHESIMDDIQNAQNTTQYTP